MFYFLSEMLIYHLTIIKKTRGNSIDSIQGPVSCLIYFQQLSVMFVATQLCQSKNYKALPRPFGLQKHN